MYFRSRDLQLSLDVLVVQHRLNNGKRLSGIHLFEQLHRDFSQPARTRGRHLVKLGLSQPHNFKSPRAVTKQCNNAPQHRQPYKNRKQLRPQPAPAPN
jgi:hypothetical protein